MSICAIRNTYVYKTRRIIRYRAAATLWRPQIRQYTASNEGEGWFTKPTETSEYDALQPMAVSEYYVLQLVHFQVVLTSVNIYRVWSWTNSKNCGRINEL